MSKIIDKVVKCNVSAFIVPNRASLASSYLIRPEERVKAFEDLANDNSMLYNSEKDHLVQLWLHSKDLNTENLVDHGGSVEDENGTKYRINLPSKFGFLPESFFDGKVEGDSIHIKTPATAHVPGESKEIDIVLDMNLTLKQQGYRYSRFGNFEEVLKEVCA